VNDVFRQIGRRKFGDAAAVEDVPVRDGVGIDLVEVALNDEAVS
jgi:hypothetical protein